MCFPVYGVLLQSCAGVLLSGTSLSPNVWGFILSISFDLKIFFATLHQWRRLRCYQRCISWSDKALSLVPAQQHPVINKSSRKEAFVTVYLHCFSSSPLISSSENWCALRLKQWVWQVMVSVITAQISSAGAFSPHPPPDTLCVQLLQLSARLPVIQCIR